ncbi:MAG TPA: hypothetical protein VKJ65_06355 [Phycisphaerae bacterium]|jgi:hypothetical protein|nr:hypothetical protein [Phycisphaerae bacterium]
MLILLCLSCLFKQGAFGRYDSVRCQNRAEFTMVGKGYQSPAIKEVAGYIIEPVSLAKVME